MKRALRLALGIPTLGALVVATVLGVSALDRSLSIRMDALREQGIAAVERMLGQPGFLRLDLAIDPTPDRDPRPRRPRGRRPRDRRRADSQGALQPARIARGPRSRGLASGDPDRGRHAAHRQRGRPRAARSHRAPLGPGRPRHGVAAAALHGHRGGRRDHAARWAPHGDRPFVRRGRVGRPHRGERPRRRRRPPGRRAVVRLHPHRPGQRRPGLQRGGRHRAPALARYVHRLHASPDAPGGVGRGTARGDEDRGPAARRPRREGRFPRRRGGRDAAGRGLPPRPARASRRRPGRVRAVARRPGERYRLRHLAARRGAPSSTTGDLAVELVDQLPFPDVHIAALFDGGRSAGSPSAASPRCRPMAGSISSATCCSRIYGPRASSPYRTSRACPWDGSTRRSACNGSRGGSPSRVGRSGWDRSPSISWKPSSRPAPMGSDST